jgi:hypothetical protein
MPAPAPVAWLFGGWLLITMAAAEQQGSNEGDNSDEELMWGRRRVHSRHHNIFSITDFLSTAEVAEIVRLGSEALDASGALGGRAARTTLSAEIPGDKAIDEVSWLDSESAAVDLEYDQGGLLKKLRRRLAGVLGRAPHAGGGQGFF